MLKTGSSITISAALLAFLAGCGHGADQTPSSADQTRTTKAPASRAAVDDTSISAELLTSILLANTGGGNRSSYYYQYAAHPWSGSVPGGKQQAAPRHGNVLGYQYYFPSVRELGIKTLTAGSNYGFLEDSRRFTSLGHEFNFQIDRKDLVEQGNGSYTLKPSASVAAGKTLAVIGAGMSATTQTTYMPASNENLPSISLQYGPEKTVTLKSAHAYQLRAGDRVPLYRSLHRWQDAQGNFTELLLLKGDNRRAGHQDVRLCVNTHAPDVKRLHCSIWQVPHDWKSGSGLFPMHYDGIYTVDDRTAYPGESGLRYWQTPESPQTSRVGLTGPQPAATPMGAVASAPIAHEGISGDVLATMLTQSTQDLFYQALPWTAPVPWGHQIQRTDQNINGLQHFRYVGSRDKQTFEYNTSSYAYAHNTALAYSLAGFKFGVSVLTTIPYAGSAADPFRFQGHHARGTELLNLGQNAQLETPKVINGNDQVTMMLHPAGGFSVRKDQFFPFNRGLHRWSNKAGHFIEMLLLRARRPDQARLCFNFHGQNIKRLQCSNWQVPSGWTLGQPLIPRGFSVIDDRTLYPGESGLRYWQTEALD